MPQRMTRTLAQITALLLLGGVFSVNTSADELLTYKGELASVTTEPNAAGKEFTLVVLVPSAPDAREILWTLDESGSGSWTWVDRFGRMEWNERGRLPGEADPSLRFDAGEIAGDIALTLIIPRSDKALAPGLEWEHDGLQYTVQETEAAAGAEPAYRVSARNNYGEKRSVLVTLPAGLVTSAQELVFLGQGDKFRLKYEVAERKTLSNEEAQQARQDFQAITALRERLQVKPRADEQRWNSDQLAILKADLPALAEKLKTPGLISLVRNANQQSNQDRGRAGALDALKRKALEQKLPDFHFEPVSGDAVKREDLNDVVTILHFWEYRDAPLREPYGQVGYLDYLQRKYEGKGVRVLGVVVNQHTENVTERKQAVASARRFASFMNIGYPLFVDDGGLLEKIGDPRVCEASLPLFVAIGKDGRLVHYSAGHYEVDNNQGLVELESVIKKALENAE